MDKMRYAAIYMRVARNSRAWIYCRVAAPDAFALKTQQEKLTAFAEKNHYEVVGCTSEQGAGTIMERPGLAEITNAVLRGEMDILLVLNVSILGRDIWRMAEYVDWLAEHNVEVICLDGELSIQEVRRFLRTKQAMQGGAFDDMGSLSL